MFEKNTIFLQVFEVFCSCFENPLFLVLASAFGGFVFFVFLFFSCCCLTNQVAMFWFLFLLFWVSLLWLCGMCCFFGLFLVCFVFLEGLRVK